MSSKFISFWPTSSRIFHRNVSLGLHLIFRALVFNWCCSHFSNLPYFSLEKDGCCLFSLINWLHFPIFWFLQRFLLRKMMYIIMCTASVWTWNTFFTKTSQSFSLKINFYWNFFLNIIWYFFKMTDISEQTQISRNACVLILQHPENLWELFRQMVWW